MTAARGMQVIDLISLKPFDMETITNSVRKTRKVIIVEECMKTGGIGASLSAVINEALFDELDHQARRPGLKTPSRRAYVILPPAFCLRYSSAQGLLRCRDQ